MVIRLHVLCVECLCLTKIINFENFSNFGSFVSGGNNHYHFKEKVKVGFRRGFPFPRTHSMDA